MRLIAACITAFLVHTAWGQELDPAPDPIPADLFLTDLHEAYSAPFAEEVTIRVRTPSGDRTDTVMVRIDPGAPADPARPKAVLLELGRLTIYIADGKLTAVSSAAPDKVYQRTFTGPITPGRLAELIPPMPLPQLAIANSSDPNLAAPLELLRKTVWQDAKVDEGTRPLTLTMTGTSPSGSIALTALVSTVRLTKVTATIRRPDDEAQLEFTVKAAEPGDPATWAPETEGRHSVQSLTDLRTTPKPLELPTSPQPEKPPGP